MQVGTLHHSGHVLLLARQAHARAETQPTEAEVSIALSAAALEGFINEVAHSASHFAEHVPAFAAFAEIIEEAEEARLQPLTKLRLGLFVLSGRLPRKGEPLPQNIAALMRLRNSLMHLKPDPVFQLDESKSEEHPRPPKEVQHLLSLGVVSLPGGHGYSWRQVVSVPAVSKWAYGVSVAAMRALVEAIPEHPWKAVFTVRVQHLQDLE